MVQTGMILGGRYEILEHIGSGGMADVYKARCLKTNRYVAVKVLRKEYSEDETLIRRFTSEARSTADLHHPNVVSILDEGNDQGIHYIVMELAEGMTLKRYIRRYGRLSVRETVDFAIQIASGIQAAHEHGIVHRDIKPQNIIVSDSGKIKVTDFGIAKAATGDTIASSTMGSVRYLSPEQARGGYSDARSDIYSLGITMYEMATGKVPFDGENTVAIALMHLRDEIVPPRNYFPDIPVSLENIILKCTRKKPEERYQTAEELIADLKQVFLSPDGSYVYMAPQVDDSPTRARSEDEIAQIKKNLVGSGTTQSEEGQEEVRGQSTDGDGEDYEDDDSVHPKMEKMILTITIVFGVLLACLVFYLIGSSTNLLRFSGGGSSTEAVTESSEQTEDTEEATADTEAPKEYVTVPDFIGMTRVEARNTANEHSLKAEFDYADGVSEDESDLVVVEQEYEKNRDLLKDSTITLTLGQKPGSDDRVEVPPLINYEEEEAIDALEDIGLKAEVIYANSDTVEEGYVIRQTPKGGSLVDEGFTVTITVSRGVSQVKVPDLYGVSQEAAEKELNRLGLELGDVSSDYSGSVGEGDVIDQSIESGTMVDKGTAVSITISLGEQETYHYAGIVQVFDSPFEDGETGDIELVLEQGNSTRTIYSEEDADADSFPVDVSFESDSGRDATVLFYVNGQEYNSYPVVWERVAD
ncbi:MAG: Stk1 family PASTA domain-containing Ser/Thr kinase [Clostridiales bacterium]|nr:Stk1 family PASTA domain-containing Ser/Thr kinase [Clostridiales bacterium]